MQIDSIQAKIIVDSRGEETIEISLISGQYVATASVPAGKSKGEFEAVPIPASKSLEKIEQLKEKLLPNDWQSLEQWDANLLQLDGTDNKSNLGANTILALSIAFLRLQSLSEEKPLYKKIAEITGNTELTFPRLFENMINGGLHADKNLACLPFQEHIIIPKTNSPKKGLEIAQQFIAELEKVIVDDQGEKKFGDEGGFIVSGFEIEKGLELLMKALNSSSLKDEIDLGIDIASSSFFNEKTGTYLLDQKEYQAEQLTTVYKNIIEKYPIISLEDPLEQNAFSDWAHLRFALPKDLWIIGDDLTVTNMKRIVLAQNHLSANAIIIKPNQIGSVSETLKAINLAKQYNWKIIISHRSGETLDTFIADLAYGVSADGIKVGSPLQEERLVKYNRLIEIENEIQYNN